MEQGQGQQQQQQQSGWCQYTENMKLKGVELCGIHGKEDGNPWAQVDEFKLPTDDILRLKKAIQTNDTETNYFSCGVQLLGKKWTPIRIEQDEELLILRGKDADNSKQLLVVAMSNRAVLFGSSYKEEVSSGTISFVVQEMRDYLKKLDY